MAKPYSQLRAMLAITKGSLKAVFRSPSAVIFSFVFPLIFILVFGFIGGGNRVSVRVAVDSQSDTTNVGYQQLKNIPGFNIIRKNEKEIDQDLEKGRISAVINFIRLSPSNDSGNRSSYKINLTTSEAVNPQNLAVIRSILEGVIKRIDEKMFPGTPSVATIDNEVKTIPGRTYRTIDFILPGQLGFSLLTAGVFGVAFIFFNLRQTLVLKRFFATPIKRAYIVLSEGISRVLFGLITAVVILVIGRSEERR